ncbi:MULTISPECIES: 2-succinyl-5-enolpyruvyl-6-hydroxy-3-cyclohexene-1-carboxylic-acid synthase [unclassified Geobacillus]|uniref:2-succinyl-5-enolpyruvyl-6-hydroxy-3- cyclohexene-1-carboxylic-acid synthase n=1 Tax=unclassified Geobacillus TaxID=2642459 RepID=UPI000BE292C3|nr:MULTISPECIES: 2-succinyl-5-enolpyruvyl-6-hydroxy-3-cyclohexene-1-carboxylic-acid synthase [unclassified Geobacillus]PDM41703.1 2-succinyl-5-enolpyruvyl-6-hydroxy-3-cyclohexene-1-carboxylic-acid synthase [Parageobacillus yumthangensis]RDV23470.1 2-succinyl-5-enolpyruvyl-6-hydroxy-3-cyclohexene-1-carboxylic-acid synthase [Parageobacillus toebii]TXK91526.1 2-succinyl-5-enolpyruvyl-6-hydroxy-3-cyclohexene-1-carboxylic-acid synthase [Parageobacillus sp. SY1]PUF90184.1 2-succinyl-5-enolpyruvyl-6-h
MNEALTLYIAAFVDELAKIGVQDVVVSPGSRSTPLAIMMAEHPAMRVHINIDERSAAFFALGMAKAKRHPIALLCTSGTAVANYFPAVVEAYYSRVPLIVITADRPHELRDVGAPQAIDQLNIYGRYAKWFVEMALPEKSTDMLRYARTMAARAAGVAISAPAGPVHLNFPLREPLVPIVHEETWEQIEAKEPSYTTVIPGKMTIGMEQIQELYNELSSAEKGLIVCGQIDQPAFAEAVTKLAEMLDFPILADPLSQLRSGTHAKEYIIDSYDAILKDETIAASLVPDVVIRFGAMPVSKPLFLLLKRYPSIKQIVVDGEGGWREPTLMASYMVYCDEVEFCRRLIDIGASKQSKSQWSTTWKMINDIAKSVLLEATMEEELFEGKVFTELSQLLPDGATLFVGNSMPIRDTDTFFFTNDKEIRILANRGANGIDGVVSSALGASAVTEPLVLVIGDLSFYHDLNGLLAAKMHGLHATIIVLNNNGGGIFSFLPQAKHKKHFEMLFGTPTDLQFEHAVRMYEGNYQKIKTWDEFRHYVTQSLTTDGLHVMEVCTSRENNVRKHRLLWEKVSQEIAEFLEKGRMV